MAISVKDIIYEEDVKFANGDFDINFSDDQHVEDILKGYLGHWKQTPLLGVGIEMQLNAKNSEQQIIKRKIQQQLNSDGYNVGEIIVTENKTFSLEFERIKNQRIL